MVRKIAKKLTVQINKETDTLKCLMVNQSVTFEELPYSAKFSRAVNFADFANSNSIAKIIFVKITILICSAQN